MDKIELYVSFISGKRNKLDRLLQKSKAIIRFRTNTISDSFLFEILAKNLNVFTFEEKVELQKLLKYLITYKGEEGLNKFINLINKRKDYVLGSNVNTLGCYCCCRSYPQSSVISFVGEDERALCPYCKIDAVVEVSDKETLEDLNVIYFG